MVKPKKLNIGDKVAIVSLSSGILGEAFVINQLNLGIKRLKSIGLEPYFMPNALKGMNYIKNNPEARANDLIEAFKDFSIKAIICAIGGDDTYKIIPFLMKDNYFKELVLKNPKIFIGFSDSTNNHIVLNSLGLVTYYGLNYLSDLCEMGPKMLPVTKSNYLRFFTNENIFKYEASDTWYLNRLKYDNDELGKKLIEKEEKNGYIYLGSGKIEGLLWGGCLESIYDIYSSERYADQYEIYQRYDLIPNEDFFKDKIIFLETSEETIEPIKFESMLLYLINHKVLSHAKAILIGKPYDEVHFYEYKAILEKINNEFNLNIVYNLNFGHALPRMMIPYGIKTQINFELKEVKSIEKLFED